ncbi:MAG: ACT domain-containing protein, partial [Promethearchaeota archaeon]
MPKISISIQPENLAVCKLSPDDVIPTISTNSFFSLTKTVEEISVVLETQNISPTWEIVEKGWRSLKVDGPLIFSLTGILSSIAGPLAESKVSIFAISTYDTDYILVK